MANRKQLKILKEGVEVWNRWREQASEVTLDLSRANLSRVNLSRVNLARTFLTGASLVGANLRGGGT